MKLINESHLPPGYRELDKKLTLSKIFQLSDKKFTNSEIKKLIKEDIKKFKTRFK